MKKKILDRLARLNVINEDLYRQKAKLRDKVLNIDLRLYQLASEYEELVRSLFKD